MPFSIIPDIINSDILFATSFNTSFFKKYYFDGDVSKSKSKVKLFNNYDFDGDEANIFINNSHNRDFFSNVSTSIVRIWIKYMVL